MSKPNTPEDFWRRVERGGPTQCWPWQASRDRQGYGKLGYKGSHWLAHRLAYTFAVGDIPEGKIVMHSCDNPRCCNPAHLECGTVADNNADSIAKGRRVWATGIRDGNAKFTDEQIRTIVRHPGSNVAVGQKFGMSHSWLSKLRRGLWRKDALLAAAAAREKEEN